MLIRDGATLVRSAADILEAIGPIGDEHPLASPEFAATFEEAEDDAGPEIIEIASIAQPRPGRSRPEAGPDAHSGAGHPSHQARILARLGPTPLAEDQLIRDLKLPANSVAPALLDLELDGRITRHAGGLVSLS